MTQHIDTLIADIREIERASHKLGRLPRGFADLLLKAKAHAIQAERWQAASAPVQTGMFGDTPKEPIRVPYSDTGASLQAAKGVIESGSAKRWRMWCLRCLEKAGHTCDELVQGAENMTNRSMHSNISARLNGLEQDGFAIREGQRKTRSGRMAGIYKITTKGREALAQESKR